MKAMHTNIKIYILHILIGALLSGIYYVTQTNVSMIEAVLFTLGCALAIALLFFDETLFSQKYAERGVAKQVVMTRSLLFVLTLFPLGIFVMTSSGSSLGMGLLMMLLGGLFSEMLFVVKNTDVFNARFASQLRKPWEQNTIYTYVAGVGFFWLLLLLKMFMV